MNGAVLHGVDAAMPGLARAMDPSVAGPILAGLLVKAGGAPGPGKVPGNILRGVRLVRHKPGRRALVEYRCGPDAGGGQDVVVLAKLRAKGLDRKTVRAMRALEAAGFGAESAEGVSVPPFVGEWADIGAWFQVRVPGRTLEELLLRDGQASATSRGGSDGVRVAAGGLHDGDAWWSSLADRVVAAVGRLQHCGVAPARRHTLADELTILRDRLGRVAEERPEWRGRLEVLLARGERLAAGLGERRLVPCHRDFHPAQMLWDDGAGSAGANGRLWWLDFDQFCWGDPALDVGNFAAHLTELAVRFPARRARLLAFRDRLMSAWIAQGSDSSGGSEAEVALARSVRVHHLLTLLRHVYLSTRYAERVGWTGELLGWCEAESRTADVA